MIPKVIHYCWFGKNKKPKKITNCIKSWKKYLPDYDIICWDESNCDVAENKYVKEAYDNKKWAFVADYFRAKVLFLFGGIYLDTDMKMIKNIDFALSNHGFCGLANPGIVSMGLLGFEKGNPLIKKHFESYKDRTFIKANGDFDLKTNVTSFSNDLINFGLGKDDKFYDLGLITIYPTEYFYPTDFDGTRSNFTDNTCSVHLHLATWLPPYKRFKAKMNRFIHGSCLYRMYIKIKKR